MQRSYEIRYISLIGRAMNRKQKRLGIQVPSLIFDFRMLTGFVLIFFNKPDVRKTLKIFSLAK